MSGHDFQIELGQSTRRHIEQKKSPLNDPALCALPYDDPKEDQIPVFVAESVLRSIERHVLSDKQHEVGGVLLGEFYRNDNGSFVEVTDFIEARNAKGSDVSLTFSHETWEQINSEQSRRGGDARIVGWYHSHPGLGVFMSREDEFIHTSYFTDPWHVALVVDPIYHNWGCFKWRDGSLERASGFYVFGDKKAGKRVREFTKSLNETRQTAPRHASANAQRVREASEPPIGLWVAVGLLVLWQVVVGFFVFKPPPAPPDYLAQAKEYLSISDMEDARIALKRAIDQDPHNDAAFRDLQRVEAVMADDRYRAYDNDRLDLENLMLSKAQRAASEGQKLPEGSLKESLFGSDQGKSSPPDPAKMARDTYEKCSKTRGQRQARARLVKEIVAAHDGIDLKKQTDKTGIEEMWYSKAVGWLDKEPLRDLAYELTGRLWKIARRFHSKKPADKESAQKDYAPLNKEEQRILDKCKNLKPEDLSYINSVREDLGRPK